ncbi:Glu/Leu/Phe/Val dehydrogenase dimerization domain-containing protein [Streptomyces fulvoviolaceus]|uniref:Glu/Leu/Phe/Val dehydrogenase dimerization domain-containing protein n=1 Tax=Streptomyces fulvoviolaceus TaxID=285535 RepID=UPI0004C85DEF|nr:Glu/Leu/Phe/Val dehydrogenase dimerization domain-containing protein [Streptomyces fulvoviolaceus]MCT9079312.1 Glu/Leu/Phe/Val dehydrogenase [Streptomyces fulvoviolaceus]
MTQTLEHEEVAVRSGRRSGLTLVVALHSRTLGPAVGGCRMRRYDSWYDGLADALRLSEAMTHKCAAAGLDFGGGKSVIVLDRDTDLTPALREAALADLGELIASFEGSYRTGPDIGTSPADMATLRRWTPYVFCLPEEHGGTGDSGIPTATGVFAALRAGARHVFGTGSLEGRTVVVSGYGSVGSRVAAGLAADGARVLVSDVEEGKRDAARRAGLEWVEPDKALGTSADVLVPAAVGGVLTPETAAGIDARLVVGPANNQLTDDRVADALAARGIIWIPDFVAGAGGVVYTLTREIEHLTHEEAVRRVEGIGDTVSRLLDTGTTPLHEAKNLVADRLSAALSVP